MEETHSACAITEAAITKAKSVHGEVESRVASLVAQAKVSTAQVVDALSKHVKEVIAHSEARTSHVIGSVAQRFEKEIEANVISAAATSEQNM